MWSSKNISHIEVYFFKLSNPTRKTKTGTANWWETTNSKSPAAIILVHQSETGSNSPILFITLFIANHIFKVVLCLLPSSAFCEEMLGHNHIAQPKQHVLTFLHPISFSWAICWALLELILEHLQLCSVCDPAKLFLTPKVLVICFVQPHT